MNKKIFVKIFSLATTVFILSNASTCGKTENTLTEEEQKILKAAFTENGIFDPKNLNDISNAIVVAKILLKSGVITQQQNASPTVHPSLLQAASITTDGINLANSLAEKIKGQDFSAGKTPKISAIQGTCVATAVTPV